MMSRNRSWIPQAGMGKVCGHATVPRIATTCFIPDIDRLLQ